VKCYHLGLTTQTSIYLHIDLLFNYNIYQTTLTCVIKIMIKHVFLEKQTNIVAIQFIHDQSTLIKMWRYNTKITYVYTKAMCWYFKMSNWTSLILCFGKSIKVKSSAALDDERILKYYVALYNGQLHLKSFLQRQTRWLRSTTWNIT